MTIPDFLARAAISGVMLIKPFLRSLPTAESNQWPEKVESGWEKWREWALNRKRQKGEQKVWIMKIKPVIAIILEALASFVSVSSDTISCPSGILHEA